MCYTGKCRYEIGCGENVGDCKLIYGQHFPADAYCSELVPEFYSAEEKKLEEQLERLRDLQSKKGRFKWGNKYE